MDHIDATRALKVSELHNELERLRRRLFDLRSQAVTEKLEDPTQIGKTRKQIARVLTVLHERGEKNIEQTQRHLTAQAVRSK
ncbi:MAG: 50S ribosomal protein L29 [Phycisphaerales bacterium]|nr:50S ribosomal protein L29 [Phycisphaerales bacterium]